jgi:hypothetical protein
MFSYRLNQWCRCALLMTLIAAFAASTASAYVPTCGTGRHEVQSIRFASANHKRVSDFAAICAETSGRSAEIATILQQGLLEDWGFNIPLQGLDQVSSNANQIILGVISNPTIAALAAAHKQNTIDVGTEGYSVISLPNPFSTNGSWRILLVAADTKGVFRGAQTLLGLVEESCPNPPAFGDFRARDYPDHQFRSLMHWIPALSGTKSDYVAARRAEFKDLARYGCNTLLLGDEGWWHMDDSYGGYPIYEWMNEVAKEARAYGIEPVPEIYPLPYLVGYENPGLREGEYVFEEPFVVTSNPSGGYMLTPQIAPFDNAASNLGFETHSGAWPDNWTIYPTADFTYASDEKGHYLQHNTASFFYVLRSWNDMSLFKPRSLYVLEVTFANAPSNASVRVYGKNSVNQSYQFPGEPLFDGTGVKNYYFWTPPLDAAHAPAEYNAAREALPVSERFLQYPYFSEFVSFHLQIDSDGAGTSAMRLDGFFLERRESSLRNVMLASSDSYLGISDDGLPVTVKNSRTQEICGPGQYTFNYVPPLNFLMRTHEYPTGGGVLEAVSSITWQDESMLNDVMLVSYTLGVPCDWFNQGQRTRYCMSSAALYERMGAAIEDLYTVFPGQDSAINPKYIDIRIDEMRGINRCGRCEAEGKTNAMHLIDYIKNIQSILDHIANGNPEHPAAKTALTCSWDMLNPWHNGSQPQYQYIYGGRWGVTSGELHELAGTNVKLVMHLGSMFADSARTQTPVWPGSEAGSADVHVAACLLPEGSPAEYDVPEYFAKQSTWYAPDCIGFSAAAVYNTQHTDAEHRWLDYAWKRYKHPDATLHEYQNDFFVTDDTGGHLIELAKGNSLTYAPFGDLECRDPQLSGWTLSGATINWGSGTPESVFGSLNAGLVPHQFNTAGTFNITLSVTATPSGGDPVTTTAVIPITVKTKDQEPIPIDPSEQSPDKGVPFGVKSIAPNPFNPTTTIRFGLPRASEVRLVVYDVAGRQVKALLDNERMPAGLHSIVWDGRNGDGKRVASGIYFVRLKSDREMQTRKVVLIR